MRQEEFLRKGLEDLIKNLKQTIGTLNQKCMIEIGSYSGESSVIFATHFGLVICVDPFIDDYDPNDDTCNHAPMSEVEKVFDERTKLFTNIMKIKLTSDEAAIFIKNNDIKKTDFVYIDGMHTFEQVVKDIQNFIPFINSPKIIGGHDYHDNWIGVKNAVEQELGIPDAIFIDTSWIKKIE